MLAKRKTWHGSLFDSFRLRALQRFTLTAGGGAGLTLDDQARLYELLDIWEGTRPGMPVDDGHEQTLREAFPTCNAFKDAVRDDIDGAVLDAGWRKIAIVEDSLELVAYFRSALEVILRVLRTAKTLRLWSGGDKPGAPTDARESALDGDAFRMNESVIVNEQGEDYFVLGIHVFSDATQVSCSGGKLAGPPHIFLRSLSCSLTRPGLCTTLSVCNTSLF